MKLIILWLINTIFIFPLKIVTYIFKLIFKIINNIYFNNLDWEYINNMEGYEFEHFTKILLEKNGFKQVTVSQSSNDYGIDVLATKNKYTYAIQCKRYNQKVGIKAVQEAKSGCEYYQCDIPVVFTNNTFSPAAINLAKSADVQLWDKDILNYFLKKSKLITKSLPFYYPLISFLSIIIIGYLYLLFQQKYLLIILLINLFLFSSIIIKIFNKKRKASFKITKPKYIIHDYNDTID